MSADPFTEDKGMDPLNVSGGNIIKTFLYSGGTGSGLRLFSSGGVQGYRVADQYTIPPYNANLSFFHPCFKLNKQLGKCNANQDPEMRLPGRCAQCSTERQELMKCFTKTKYSHPQKSAPTS
ncbi:DNA damage response protein WSS1-like protein [Perkinsela sp. CCAP 1560/4]|nr:DNA damage response protein WSS1-like protein [Perkinsela sp. CCAP 1560/4]|eukprot:KNH06586.1 DNA damage response protein WSS1-like protein [Perkinsela sp. CCAP 1560/4]